MKLFLVGVCFLLGGCAAAKLQQGKTYAVKWPGEDWDVVVIEKIHRHGLVSCRTVDTAPIFTCNMRMANYWTEVKKKTHQPPQTTIAKTSQRPEP